MSSRSIHASPQILNQTDVILQTVDHNQSQHMNVKEHHETMDHSIEPENHERPFDNNISLNLTISSSRAAIKKK